LEKEITEIKKVVNQAYHRLSTIEQECKEIRDQEEAPRVLSPFRGEGIVCLSDPDSYAGWSFYTPDRATQARQVEG